MKSKVFVGIFITLVLLSIVAILAFEHYKYKVPEDHVGLKSNTYLTSKIESCQSDKMNKSGKYFIGFKLAGYEEVFRMNTYEHDLYMSYCRSNAKVRVLVDVTYNVLANDVAYWIKELEVIN